MSSTPKVSIIVLSHLNWNRYTRDFLVQIMEKTDFQDYEVICVNNGNGKGITKDFNDWIAHDKRFKMIESEKNLGFAGGNNLAAKYAKGEYLLFINDDIIIHNKGWLSNLVKAKNDKNIVGAQLIKNNQHTAYKYKTQEYLGGWCVLVTRDEFESIGGWEETFGKAFYEDVWFSRELAKKGKKLVQVETGLEHLISKTVSRFNVNDFTNFGGLVYKSKMSMDQHKKRIVFYYNGYGFLDEDYEGKGVGGAEASLIQLSRKLYKLGWRVEIYNQTQTGGQFNGVWYFNISEFNPFEYCDVFVLWRDKYNLLQSVFARTKIFFSCDQRTSGDWNRDILPHIDGTICISEYHRDYLVRNYHINKKDITIMDLGVKEEDYTQEMSKQKNKLIYCSVPNRGLAMLAEAFPRIREKVPDAELYITSDYRLWGQKEPHNKEYIEMFRSLPNVHFLGKIPRDELVKHQLTAEVMAYPCMYDENFCISAMECIASGTVPVTFDIGAMKTTVGDSGIVLNVDARANRAGAVARFANEVSDLLKDRDRLESLAKSGKTRALKKYSWTYLGKKYSNLFAKFLDNGTVLSLEKCEICGEDFDTGFDMFKHRVKEHTPAGVIPEKRDDKDMYMIITAKKDVELSLNNGFYSGRSIKVPAKSSNDIIRILKEAYGDDIILSID